jgi:hypothetical protein
MADLLKNLAFSVGVAVFLSLVGAFESGSVPLVPRTISFIILGIGITSMIPPCIWISSRLPWVRERQLTRRIFLTLVLTPLTACWLWLAIGVAFLHGPKAELLPAYFGYSFIMSVAMNLLTWAIFRKRHPPIAPAGPVASKFLERLPFRLRDAELYAVEAEDHYLRVRTSRGSELILMRLSDALSELEGLEGAQTHRSWWVAKAGIADVRRADGRATLTLKDGSEAPVSRSHARTLREAGWL